jgi:hypothetical protein
MMPGGFLILWQRLAEIIKGMQNHFCSSTNKPITRNLMLMKT